jgi:hypothetical protein
VSRNDDTIIEGNFVVRDSGTSLVEMHESTLQVENNIDVERDNIVNVNDSLKKTNDTLDDNKNYIDDLVDAVNEFNAGVDDELKQIRFTVEDRLLPLANPTGTQQCSNFDIRKFDLLGNYFWLNSSGSKEVIDYCPAVETNGLIEVSWDEFNKR